MMILSQFPAGEDFHTDVTGGDGDQQTPAAQTQGTTASGDAGGSENGSGKKTRKRRTKKEMQDARAAASTATHNLPLPPAPGSVAMPINGAQTVKLPAAEFEYLRAEVKIGNRKYIVSIAPADSDA